jgi:hypothetical protein
VEVSEVRRRLRGAIERARVLSADRRVRMAAAARDYDELLEQRAVPVFHQLAAALVAEGHLFKVFTPAGSVRLASERSAEEFIELTLDDSADQPEVVGRVSRGRGRRMISSEMPLKPRTPIASISQEDVMDFLIEEIVAFIER